MEKLIVMKMQNYKILLLLVALLMVSCEKKSLSEVLTGGSFRYWLYLDGKSPSSLDSAYNASRATRQDSLPLRVYFDLSKRFFVYFGDYKTVDYYYTHEWKITNDSLLEIFHRNYVVKEHDDERILLEFKSKGSGELIVDTMEAIDLKDVPIEYRKYRTLPPPPKGMFIY